MIAMNRTAVSHTGAQHHTSTNTIKQQPQQAKEADKQSGHSIDTEDQDSIDFVSPDHQDNLVPGDKNKDSDFAHFLAPEENATAELAVTSASVASMSPLSTQFESRSVSVTNTVNNVELSHQQASSISLLQAVRHQTQSTDTSAADAVKVKGIANPDIKAMQTLSTAALLDRLTNAHLSDKKPVDVASLRIEQQVADINAPERLVQQASQGRHEWSAVKMDSQQNAWSKQLFNVLQDRIEMQVHQNIKQANIRLDPPDLGRLDLSVRMDGDRLTVMVNTSNSAIRDALQASLQQLRSELSNQFGTGVDVNVGGGSGEKEFKERENNVALSFSEEQTENAMLPPIELHGLFNTLV